MAQTAPGKFGRFLDADVTINSVNLSSFVKAVRIEQSTEILDQSAMGDFTRVKVAGMKEWQMVLEMYQSYYTAEVDDSLNTLYDNGTNFTIVVKPTSDAVGPYNPSWTGTGFLPNYSPIAGAHAELLTTDVTIESAGDLVRATA
jgi:predicted secreted protein